MSICQWPTSKQAPDPDGLHTLPSHHYRALAQHLQTALSMSPALHQGKLSDIPLVVILVTFDSLHSSKSIPSIT